MSKEGLTIGALASLSGVTPEAIRYYEREGVIPEALRVGSGKYRHYSHEDAKRLRFVRRARDLGFSLEHVRELVALAEKDPSTPCGEVNEVAHDHLARIEEKLAQLSALHAELSRLTQICDRDAAIGECTLLAALAGEDDTTLRENPSAHEMSN